MKISVPPPPLWLCILWWLLVGALVWLLVLALQGALPGEKLGRVTKVLQGPGAVWFWGLAGALPFVMAAVLFPRGPRGQPDPISWTLPVLMAPAIAGLWFLLPSATLVSVGLTLGRAAGALLGGGRPWRTDGGSAEDDTRAVEDVFR